MSLRCPYCHGALAGAEPVRCRACETPVHAECATMHGRCVVLGCDGEAFEPLAGAPAPGTLRYREPLARVARALLVAPAQGATPFLLGAVGLAALGWLSATVR